MKSPAVMSAAQINRELDAIDKKHTALLDEFIAAGRGSETSNETRKKSDPLALRYIALSDRRWDLKIEIERRAGPGMSRLPRGFGPRSS